MTMTTTVTMTTMTTAIIIIRMTVLAMATPVLKRTDMRIGKDK